MTTDASPAARHYETTDSATLDAEYMDRATAIADAIQRSVSARLDLASSLYGIGLDALSSRLRSDPTFLTELEPWVLLFVGVFNYVRTGEPDEHADALLAGTFSLPGGE